VVGKGVAGSDIIFEDSVSGNRVTGVQVKSTSSSKAAARAIRNDNKSEKPSPIIAIQVPEGTTSHEVRTAIENFPSYEKHEIAGKSVIVVDPDGNIMIPLGPIPR
jgi:hypothetical protein